MHHRRAHLHAGVAGPAQLVDPGAEDAVALPGQLDAVEAAVEGELELLLQVGARQGRLLRRQPDHAATSSASSKLRTTCSACSGCSSSIRKASGACAIGIVWVISSVSRSRPETARSIAVRASR